MEHCEQQRSVADLPEGWRTSDIPKCIGGEDGNHPGAVTRPSPSSRSPAQSAHAVYDGVVLRFIDHAAEKVNDSRGALAWLAACVTFVAAWAWVETSGTVSAVAFYAGLSGLLALAGIGVAAAWDTWQPARRDFHHPFRS